MTRRRGRPRPPDSRASADLPRLLRWAARGVERLGGTPGLADDLQELFLRRVARGSRVSAGLWASAQILRGLPGAIAIAAAPPWPGVTLVRTLHPAALRGLRRVVRTPSPSVPFVLIVGFGMAAAGSMVQLRHAVLRPDLGLGVPVHQFLWIDEAGQEQAWLELSGREAWLRDPPAGIGALLPVGVAVLPAETPAGIYRSTVQTLPEGALSSLRVLPVLGREPRAPGEVILAHDFWRTHWDGDPGVLGALLTPAGEGPPAVVVGVAPASFGGLFCCVRPQAWMVPHSVDGPVHATLMAVEVTAPEALGSALVTLLDGEGARVRSGRLLRLEDAAYGGESGVVGRAFAVLLVLAALAFLGSVLNGVNLLLADAADRAREFRLRRAVGADTLRLTVETAAEVAWLALGAALAAAAATWFMLQLGPWALPILVPGSVTDLSMGRAATFALAGAAALVTLLAGAPACAAAALGGRRALIDRGPSGGRWAAVFLTLQVTLATALAAVALFYLGVIRSMDGAFAGFRNPNAVVLSLSRAGEGTPLPWEAMEQELEAHPSVARAALTRHLPVYGAPRDTLSGPGGRRETVTVEQASSSYFEAVGLRLLSGRPGEGGDEVVVSADVAERLGGSPGALLGEIVYLGADPLRVVGVAETATWGSREARPTAYRGWAPAAVTGGNLVVHPAPRSSPVTPAVMGVAGPGGVAVAPFGTLSELLVRSRVLTELLARLALLFGALCLLVALSGLQAHFARWVRVRERELGIRMALGARPTRLGSRVLSAAGGPLGGGLAGGVLVAWAGLRLLGMFVGDTSAGILLPALLAAAGVGAAALLCLTPPALDAARRDAVRLLRVD